MDFKNVGSDEILCSEIQNFELPTPSFVVHYEKAANNCLRMLDLCKRFNVQLRPHIKTHKTLEGAILQLTGNENGVAKEDDKIVVSTLEEARFFSRLYLEKKIVGNIVYAIPLPPNKFEEAFKLTKSVPKFGILLDNLEVVKKLEEFSKKKNIQQKFWHVFVKIDCGYHRAGIDPESEQTVQLVKAICGSATINFEGIYSHSGHSYNVKSSEEAAKVAEEERRVMISFVEKLRKLGIHCPTVGIGATPSMSNAQNLEGVTEIHPGNYIFYDRFQATIGSCSFDDIACSVVTTVIAHYPDRNRMLIDAGALALSKDTGTTGPGDWALFRGAENKNLKLVSISQECGVIESRDPKPIDFSKYPIGSKLLIIPHHSCLTAACFPECVILRDGKVIGTWKTCPRGW
jgi:D-serine deaminase-like pyridoxal phosphate-dependent protein